MFPISNTSFRYQAESSGLHPDRSLCPYCGALKRMHVCRWAWPSSRNSSRAVISAAAPAATQAHSGGSVRINLSELTPAMPEAAGHSPVESDWLSDGPRVGERVLRRLKGHGYVHAVVRLYLPAGADDEPALWRIRHADGDEEDLVRTPSLIAVSTASSLHRPSAPTMPPPPLASARTGGV